MRRALAPLILATLAACGLPERRPLDLTAGFEVLAPLAQHDLEGFRAVDGFHSEDFQDSFERSVAAWVVRGADQLEPPPYRILVLSSGGVNGAFGAGVLTAWSERGDRPDFDMVTGVSVGALLAPFAFAGPAFDDRLEGTFRSLERADIMEGKGILSSLLWDESLMESEPLATRIAASVDGELLAAVALRHRAGGRLYVGTTDLDRGVFVVWDLGAVADAGGPDALDLFRRVLLASASIPVVYPPVYFATATGDEMHVDGAVTRSMFVPSGVFDVERALAAVGLDRGAMRSSMHVVHNGCLRPEPKVVQRETVDIATRSLLLMTYAAVMEHVQGLFLVARLFDADFHFLTIPDGAELMLDSFEAADCEALYQLGRSSLLVEGWRATPPAYLISDELLRLTGDER